MTGPSVAVVLASALLIASSTAGPLPPSPPPPPPLSLSGNVTLTSTEQPTQVVDACAGARCEVRAGCKALHRPDACCPAYQCECEQDGRTYGNGEKLVDPKDPCRVCYCQGGEVVCRRIACFRRDDCRPRTVPGRCCPEYDNCPLTGESTMLASAEATSISMLPPPPPPRDVPKQEITIKEITPVSEIPALIMDNSKEVSTSSRAPLIVREATTDTPAAISSQTVSNVISDLRDGHPTPSPSSDAPSPSVITPEASTEMKSTFSSPAAVMSSQSPVVVVEVTRPAMDEEDALLDHNPAFPPLPDDLSVPASHDDELLPEQVTDSDPVAVTAIGNQHRTDNELVITTTELIKEPIPETNSSPDTQIVAISERVLSTTSPTATPSTSDQPTTSTGPPTTTTTEFTPAPTTAPTTTTSAAPVEQNTQFVTNNTILEARTSTTQVNVEASPMLNLRSAIPTEILNVPSSVQEEINGELDDIIEPTTSPVEPSSPTSNNNVNTDSDEAKVSIAIIKSSTSPTTVPQKIVVRESSQPLSTEIVNTVNTQTDSPDVVQSSTIQAESATTSTISPPLSTVVTQKAVVDARTIGSSSSSIPLPVITETSHDEIESVQSSTAISPKVVTSVTPIPRIPLTPTVSSTSLPERTTRTPTSTELSSLPVETSDQNPRDTSENIVKEVKTVSTDPVDETTGFRTPVSEVTVSKEATSKTGTPVGENVETTEFIANGINWMDSATDAVDEEVGPARPSAADGAGVGVLGELIDLVGDVAAIGDQEQTVPAAEELLPVNAGYKSRHRPNANSITEPSAKGRVPTEIEEEGPVLVDALPPARQEPTTKRATIDGDGARPPAPSAASPGDFEIITRSYVPTFSRRPTKVVQASATPAAVDATR